MLSTGEIFSYQIKRFFFSKSKKKNACEMIISIRIIKNKYLLLRARKDRRTKTVANQNLF